MDVSKERPKMTAGLDLGDRYSYLCLIDTVSGEVIEEGRLRTTPEAFGRRFTSERPMRIAIEAGTHSPWVSRLLEERGHEVLVANARKLRLIYANKRKTDEIDADNLARLARVDPRLLAPTQTPERGFPGPHGHHPLARSAGGLPHAAGQPRPRGGQVLRGPFAQVPGEELPQEGQRARPRGAPAGPGTHPGADRFAHRAHPRYDRQLEAISKEHYPETELLRQVEGVGPLTALTFVLTLEDPHRFERSRSVGAYLGLVPATDRSGERDPQKRISKEGDEMLRKLLVGSAHYVLGPFGRTRT